MSICVRRACTAGLSLSVAAVLLAGCGGGSPDSAASAGAQPNVAGASFNLSGVAAPAGAAQSTASPSFHAAPIVLAEPDDVDRNGSGASATRPPHQQTVPADLSLLSTRGLTWDRIDAASNHLPVAAQSGRPTPLASGTAISTYTPAQIRAAYGLPALPPAGSTLSATAAAQLGAGQTIYLVDANNDPNVVAELAAFNQKFGLPACTTVTVAASAKLPLAAASAAGCTFSVVYATASGAMTATTPAYDSGWATEIALDVQWSHAIAPYARIVLVETPDASVNSLNGGIMLANAMGPGIVSMSFGAGEGSWTSSYDSLFTTANMTYLAATGDAGAAVDWPAVSAHVVAVGATTLTYSGTAPRSEVAWSKTGGGVSAYTATPAYQSSSVPGLGTPGHRAVADVSFNGDPSTGQYLAVIPQNSTSVNWMSAGGTSLATPQWAAIIAIANALRAQGGQAMLGAPHAALYGTIAASPTNYANAFADVTQGSDGSCTTCAAHAGYDEPTGLGTPNATSVLSLLVGTPTATTAPVVASASVSGTVGTPLAFTVTVNATHAVTYALSGAPAGMAVSTTGAVSWATPVAGTYAVTVSARDTQTGLTGTGLYTVTISPPQAPTVQAGSVQGTAGSALSFQVTGTAPHAVSYALTGAPSGMTVNASGLVSWPAPVAGSYSVTAIETDTVTKLSGKAIYTVTIAPPAAPVVTGATIAGHSGSALTYTVSVADAHPLTYTLSGAPSGMTISAAGVISWPSPVAGSYPFTVSVRDQTTGLGGQAQFTASITTGGPVITVTPMSGVAGQKMSGTISFSDSTSNTLSVTISGAPSGLGFALSGSSIGVTWANPVAGNYTLTISAKDGAGLTATATMPITVTAH